MFQHHGYSGPCPKKVPTCPICGSLMHERENRKSGELFWGCTKYPGCRGTREHDDVPGPDDATDSLADREARRKEEPFDAG